MFAAAGYDVLLTARRKPRLDEIAARVSKLHPRAQFVPLVCDVNSDASVTHAFQQVAERFGRLDALVNNAGYGVYGRAADTPLDVFRAIMETNYFGAVRCTQAAIPLLRAAAQKNRRKWGAAIVMVSSFVGRRAVPLMSPYCASKFALEGFSESLRVELIDERISVSVINPGVTRTEFVEAAQGARPENYLSPEGGMSAEDVARVVLRAVKSPSRNRFLTLAGKAGIALHRLSPALMDAVMLRALRKTSNR